MWPEIVWRYEDHLAECKPNGKEIGFDRACRNLRRVRSGAEVLSKLVGIGHPWNQVRTLGELQEVSPAA